MENWSLRVRILLFFVLLGVVVLTAGAAALFHVWPVVAEGEGRSRLVQAVAGSTAVLLGLIVWVALKFDENVAQPLDGIARDIKTTLLTGTGRRIGEKTGRYLGVLTPTARAVQAALLEQQKATDEAVGAATEQAQRQKRRLEAVLRDLHQGVVICNLRHEVMLFNQRSLAMVADESLLGLGRSVFDLFMQESLQNGVARLIDRHQAAGGTSDGLSDQLVLEPTEGTGHLVGRVALTLEGDKPVGYVIVFDDVTAALDAGLARDRLLHDVAEDMRRGLATLTLAIDLLMADRQDEELASGIEAASISLNQALDRLDETATDVLAGAWPTSRVAAQDLLHAIAARLDPVPDQLGEPLWLHCDGASIADLMVALIDRLRTAGYGGTERLLVGAAGRRAYLDFCWSGQAVPAEMLTGWLQEPVTESGVTGNDVLFRHQTDVWSDLPKDGEGRLRLVLSVDPDEGDAPVAAGARPEFYDFDLFEAQPTEALMEMPLKRLSFIVFDTETTGLEPSRGDELISVAGVRVVNNRLLSGEIFDQLINPGRSIPPASTRIHHIRDDDVVDQPSAKIVLPRFHRYVGDSVLVAHNAAFDMTFLSKRQAEAGIRFDGPVLDTVLLAAHIFGARESLTLDALAERFLVEIPDNARHTALGDSLATGEVFLCLVALLEESGVVTLGDAIRVSEVQSGLRRKQSRY